MSPRDRELAALDERPADADLLELFELAEDLRASAPRPAAAFANRLDAEAAAGFPKAAAKRGRRRWTRPAWGAQLLAGATACVLLVAVATVVITRGGGPDGGGGESASIAVESAPQSAAGGSGGSAGAPGGAREPGAADSAGSSAAPGSSLAPTPQSTAPGVDRRRVERAATLAVSVPADRFDAAAADVVRIAGRDGAIVQSSSVSQSGGSGTAEFVLRVPVRRFGATLADLSQLGRLQSREETGFDVTGDVVRARDRLGDLTAERASLRRRLAAETDTDEANALRDRLGVVQREIGAARGQLAGLRQRTSYARVDLTLRTRGETAADDDEGGAFTPGDALDDAAGLLGTLLSIAIVGLAGLLPFALLAGGAALAATALRRRRRERGLRAT